MNRNLSCALLRKSWSQTAWDFIGIPFRLLLFDQAWLPPLGWTTLEEERIRATLPHIRGRLLDVGAGENRLLQTYGLACGEGVDIHDWGGEALVVEDTSSLPYGDASFDTITLLASFNHIPNREDVLLEMRRLVREDGRLIITMINPILGGIGHCLWWYAEDRKRGGMKEGEVGGMWNSDIVSMCREAGFSLSCHERFVYGMNNLLVFVPAGPRI